MHSLLANSKVLKTEKVAFASSFYLSQKEGRFNKTNKKLIKFNVSQKKIKMHVIS